MQQVGICQLEEGQIVVDKARRHPVVTERGIELRHLEVVRTVEKVGAERHARPVGGILAAGNELRGYEAGEGERAGDAHLVGIEHR